MFSSEEENNEDEDPYLDYVPKPFDARLNEIQGMSNRQLLQILDDDASQAYEESPNEEIPPCITLSAPSQDLPEMLTPSVDEESACGLFGSLPDLPAHPEVLTPSVHEAMPPCVRFPAPSFSLPANAELQVRDRTWTTHVENFNEYNFDKLLEPTKQYSQQSLPIEYFSNLFPDEIIQMIVEYTNKYASMKQSKFWSDTNVKELKAFLAIIILMGINPQSDIELYWSADPFYNNIEISGTMTCKRFKKNLENLHVCDNSTHLPQKHKDHDKLQKIRPLLDCLNRTFQENATNSESQSVDERFKGRDSKKQYMPAKPIKRGFKAWCRCDSKTGYLYQFDIYTGKDQEANEEGLGYRVVMKLGGNLPRNTHLVFVNFFSSLALMEALYHRGILATGTVRMNRKGLPKDLCPTRPKTPEERRHAKENKLDPGEFTYRFCHPCAVVKWQDTKEVFVVTTAVNPTKVKVIQRTQKNGQKKDMFCPTAIAEYTRSMGGVDHFDHYRSSYSIGRRSKKSWFRMFWFLFESAIINAYILYNQNRKNIHRDFRLRLARSLKSGHISNKKQDPVVYKNKKGGVFGVPDEIRLGQRGSHFLALSTYKRCRFCSTRKQEKRSKYQCEICKVALCITPCMKLYHQNQNPEILNYFFENFWILVFVAFFLIISFFLYCNKIQKKNKNFLIHTQSLLSIYFVLFFFFNKG